MAKYHLIFENSSPFSDYYLNENESLDYIPNVNNINIILGANNSGKSRFIRNLLLSTKFKKVDSNLYYEYNNVLEKVREKSFSINHNDDIQPIKLDRTLSEQINSNLRKMTPYRNNRYKDYFNKMEHLIHEISQNIELNFSKKYYIPTLRTAHSLFEFNRIDKKYNKIQSDIYRHTLFKNYDSDFKGVDIFSGLDLYEQILDSRNSVKVIRERFQKFERFLSKNFFENKNIDIVAEFNYAENKEGKNDSELISIHIQGENDTRKLFDLGDGVQALIIIMYKIFMAENNTFIVIDEPELNLHPGMQRLFLEQITTNKELIDKNLTYFITTHSNHFLDLTIEKENVSIYSFNSLLLPDGSKKFQIKNVNAGDNEILKSLGVNNSSVFMANCSIWVEGISDRNYIKAFLKSYCESKNEQIPKEDIDFAFFEYAGSNIDHYLFNKEYEDNETNNIINDINALALNNRIYLLADSDATTKSSNESKYNRLKKLEDIKNNQFYPKIIWEVREIENLITNEIWELILINFCNESLLKENRNDISKKIEIALKEVDYKRFQKKYIGNFLNELREKVYKIGRIYIINKSTYEEKKGDFGTITNKRKLSELILEKNIPWEVYSKNELIQNLTIEIYNFIKNKK